MNESMTVRQAFAALRAGFTLAILLFALVGAAFAQAGNVWRELSVQVAPGSSNPFPRGSFAAGAARQGKSGWMFGGVVDDFTPNPVYNNTLFRIDPAGTNVRFTQIFGTGGTPTARAFPALAAIRKGDQEDVYIFGGGTFPFNIPLGSADKFWKYNSATNAWTDLSATGGPNARLGATLMATENALYVFGGISFNFETQFFDLHNDLWRFDTASQTWTMLSNNAGPAARHVAMGAALDDGKLLIYGGERIVVSFDPEFSISFPIDTTTWVWNLNSGGWTQLANGPARNYGAVASDGETFVMFGGDAAGGVTCSGSPFSQNLTNDFFRFNLEDGWRQSNTSMTPAPVKRTAGFTLRNQFYTFGGFGFSCAAGQIWNLKVHSIKLGD